MVEIYTEIQISDEIAKKLQSWEKETGKQSDDLVKDLLTEFLDITFD